MRSIFKPILFFFLLLFAGNGFSQQPGIGQWRDDLPYFECISVADAGTRIYAATPYAIFYYDKEDNSVQRITKITGLSDIGISTINYSKEYNTLVITYTNANIDLLKNNTIINISDIKRAPILGNKTINDVFFIGKSAYLSCGFGIVVLDIDKEEIHDTYYIGANGSQVNVRSMTKDQNDTLFAATDQGIYLADANSTSLANYSSWKKDPRMSPVDTFSKIAFFNNEVIVNKAITAATSDSVYRYKNGHWSLWPQVAVSHVNSIKSSKDYLIVVYKYNITYYNSEFVPVNTVFTYFPGSPFPLDVVCDNENVLWIGDNYSGLVSYDTKNSYVKSYNLNGPLTAGVFSMKTMGNKLYIVPGGRDNSYVPIYFAAQIYQFNSDSWENLNQGNVSGLSGIHDLVTLAPDPSDSKRFYAGSWGKGLLEFYDNQLVAKWGETNTHGALGHHTASDTSDVRIGGCAFDAAGNLWVANTVNNHCLSRKSGNQWIGYDISINSADLGQLLVDRNGQKWIVMRYSNTNPYSLLVFSDNGTPENPADDVSKKLNSAVGNGSIPGNVVYAIAEDKQGQIWIGTEKGIAVFYSPENVLTGQPFDAQQILVQQGLYTQYLMENELVTSIAVDGADNKWIGTDRGGVYQVSKDGTQQLQHFTVDNSPLFSNRITALAINPVTGEVFIGTDKGVISYKGSATEGGETNSNVYAYPNPVKEGYSGWIAIKGLVSDAQVRITDIDGNLVYSTRAEGGQAVWDGKNFNGQKARTGVYIVYANSDAGNAKAVTKILIIN